MMFLGKIRATFLLFLLFGLAAPSFGRTKELKGRIFAYDPSTHSFKAASFVENQEIVILRLDAQRKDYVKLVIHGFGQEQIPAKYFAGADVLEVKAVRDLNCDQMSVEFVNELADITHPTNQPDGTMNISMNSGKFMVSDFFRNQTLPEISNLQCYSLRSNDKLAQETRN
jgi:hypothetical protein